jgi:hypothetical protein
MARWSLPIDRYVRATKGDIEKAARAVALDMFSRIIVHSPVDTGRFRGNWMIDVSIVPEGWAEQYDRSGQATIDKSRAMLSAYKLGYEIHIRNNVPYAVRLENGWSQQAPAGVVKVSMLEIGAITAGAARRIRAGASE